MWNEALCALMSGWRGGQSCCAREWAWPISLGTLFHVGARTGEVAMPPSWEALPLRGRMPPTWEALPLRGRVRNALGFLQMEGLDRGL